jgi:hypothetical protein
MKNRFHEFVIVVFLGIAAVIAVMLGWQSGGEPNAPVAVDAALQDARQDTAWLVNRELTHEEIRCKVCQLNSFAQCLFLDGVAYRYTRIVTTSEWVVFTCADTKTTYLVVPSKEEEI